MEMMALPCISFFLALFSLTGSVSGQSNGEGFISIDCGVSSGSNYVDNTTNITYVSDDQFIDAGFNSKIASNYINGVSYQDQTLRSFPNEPRSCYTLNVIKGEKYLLRATFLYGNYDGQQRAQLDNPLSFVLHLGVTKWNSIKIYDPSVEYTSDTITVAETNTLSVCLINTGQGSPFISALEMRPVNSTLYPYSIMGSSISFLYRYNYGANQTIRYPDDPMDRVWVPYPDRSFGWEELSVPSNTTFVRYSIDFFQVPTAVYQTAVTTFGSPTLTVIHWTPVNTSIAYYNNFYICDLSSENALREFDVYLNDALFYESFTTDYLKLSYLYTIVAIPLDSDVFTFVAKSNSTLPPIVNAIEIYWIFNHTLPMTDAGDVKSITDIKVQYGINKSWTGDPCNPDQYAWDGLNCTYPANVQPTITSINLTASRLSGQISDSFNQFKEIKNLDLSCNSLSGIIPEFLGNISTLQSLNLRGNNFNGSIPDTLLEKNKTGLLNLIIGPPCTGSSPHHSNKKTTILYVAIPISISLLVIVVLLVLFLKRSRQEEISLQGVIDEPVLNTDVRQFTYKELKKMTRNFSQYLGRGGFGSVYHAFLENGREVAVKLSSDATLQHITKQFLAEANNLMQVQHKNLVSLVGYCRDRKHVALVYEFMPNRSLEDHLRGKDGIARDLSWRERVKIALEAAQGLHYLHTGRNIVHRDVKSSNILLGQNMEAKIADFGLSKMFPENATLQNTTITLCGTPGYIDPELIVTNIPTEKNDVYGFGVVLLEIVTGEPPIMQERKNVHIVQHVNQKLLEGNICEVTDSKLSREHENSILNVVDLAIQCTAQPSSLRPTMADVVKQLQDTWVLESKLSNTVFQIETMSTMSTMTTMSASSGSFSS